MCRLRSGAPSVHQTAPRSPSARLITSTALCAAASASRSASCLAVRTALRALPSRRARSDLSSSPSFGFVIRQSRPRTTKYRPSGVTGCFTPLGRLPLRLGRWLLHRRLLRRLFAGDRHQHLLLGGRGLFRFLDRLLFCLARCRGASTDALAKGVHQIDHVLSAGSLLRGDGLTGPLLVDEIDQRGFVMVLELVVVEVTGLLLDDVTGEVEHVLGDLDVLDVIEIFGWVPD